MIAGAEQRFDFSDATDTRRDADCDPLDCETVVITVPQVDGSEGWLRWRHVGARTMRTHDHEDLEVWWIGSHDRIHRTAVEASLGHVEYREFRVLDGDLPDTETEAEMFSTLASDLIRWDQRRSLHHRDRFRPDDALDAMIDTYERQRIDSAFARVAPEIARLEQARDARDAARSESAARRPDVSPSHKWLWWP